MTKRRQHNPQFKARVALEAVKGERRSCKPTTPAARSGPTAPTALERTRSGAGKALTSRIHRRKPKGKPMPQATARANAKKSSIRARGEHVSAHQKQRFGLFIRTIELARAEAKLTLANIAYNMDRLIFHERRLLAG